MKPIRLLIPALCITILFLSVAIADEPASGSITVGGRYSEGQSSGIADFLIPLWRYENGQLFADPRYMPSEGSEQDADFGLGWRHYFEEAGLIAGVNAYYDSRWTSYDHHFNQLGLGLELLSAWVDARANYYLPENKDRQIDSFETETAKSSSSTSGGSWEEPYATGYNIQQDHVVEVRQTTVTTRQLFERFETASEGWDGEVGVRLPGLDRWAEVRLFGGYYDFAGAFDAGDAEGFKGRIEIRTCSALYLDAEVFENKDLNGSDYYAGARLQLPFEPANLARGRSPFSAPARKPAGLSARLSEMVMRNPGIRMLESGPIENVDARQVTTTTHTSTKTDDTVVLMTNVVFVDGRNRGGIENGTGEHPYNTIQEGVDAAPAGTTVYVYDKPLAYRENVTIDTPDLTVMGAGVPVRGRGFQRFGGSYPVVDGRSQGPTITIESDDVTISGLKITNTDQNQPPQTVTFDGATYDISRAGVYSYNANDITLSDVHVQGNSIGALLTADAVPEFRTTVESSTFSGNDAEGLLILGRGSSGSFNAAIVYSSFDKNGAGVAIDAQRYNTARIEMTGVVANGNLADGIRFNMDVTHSADVILGYVHADNNGGDGIHGTLHSGDRALVDIDYTVANSNGQDGVDLQMTGHQFMDLRMDNVDAGQNGGGGLNLGVHSTGGSVNSHIAYVSANQNQQENVLVSLTASNEVIARFTDIAANSSANSAGFSVNASNKSGKIEMTFTNISANANHAEGFRFDAESDSGTMDIRFKEIDASDNGADGFQVNARAGARLFMQAEGITANNNADDGIDLALTTRELLEVTLRDSTAGENDGYGILLDASATNATMIARLEHIDASRNGANIAAMFEADRDIIAHFSDITANGSEHGPGLILGAVNQHDSIVLSFTNVTACGNSQYGIGILGFSEYGHIATRFVDNTIQSNGFSGLGVLLTATGNIDVFGEGNVITHNDNFGFWLIAAAGGTASLDFGGGALGSAGGNSIFGNLGAYDVDNEGSFSGATPENLVAQSNWWGTASPDGSRVRRTVYTNWLTTAPNP